MFSYGRLGQPEDAVRLITFLASEEAGWTTGQIIHSTGGSRFFTTREPAGKPESGKFVCLQETYLPDCVVYSSSTSQVSRVRNLRGKSSMRYLTYSFCLFAS